MTIVPAAKPAAAAAAIAALLMFAAPLPLLAFGFTLERQRVPTTIEGIPVELFISGPVEIALGDPVGIELDATVDLGDVQKHFAGIVRARAVDVRCGNSISLDGATIQPVRIDGRTVAEIVGDATIRQVTCDAAGVPAGAARVSRGALAVRIAARADDEERLVFDLVIGNATAPAVAKLMEQAAIRDALEAMLTDALAGAAGPSSVTASLSPDAARYDPRVRSAAFESLGTALGARLHVTLSVPLATFFEWRGKK